MCRGENSMETFELFSSKLVFVWVGEVDDSDRDISHVCEADFAPVLLLFLYCTIITELSASFAIISLKMYKIFQISHTLTNFFNIVIFSELCVDCELAHFLKCLWRTMGNFQKQSCWKKWAALSSSSNVHNQHSLLVSTRKKCFWARISSRVVFAVKIIGKQCIRHVCLWLCCSPRGRDLSHSCQVRCAVFQEVLSFLCSSPRRSPFHFYLISFSRYIMTHSVIYRSLSKQSQMLGV